MATDGGHALVTAEPELGLPVLETDRMSVTQPSSRVLTEEAGFLRSGARQLNADTQRLHNDTQLHEWTSRASARGKEAPLDLLMHLSDLGFSWRDIARMLGVSVPAIQKWRKGARLTGESRRALANLVAACDLIQDDYSVSEVASWFEMPLLADVPVTPIDLYASGHFSALFDYAGDHADTETILAMLDPDWKLTYHSDFEVFRAEDGNLSIRSKG